MRKDVIEANVVMAKCKNSYKPFGIRIEKRKDNIWHCTWAFKLSEKAGSKEGYENNTISGQFHIEPEYPGCPDCGSLGWINCSKCGKLTCFSGEETHVRCAWCGMEGEIQSVESFDLKGGGF